MTTSNPWCLSEIAAHDPEEYDLLAATREGDLSKIKEILSENSYALSGDFGSHLVTDAMTVSEPDVIKALMIFFPNPYLWDRYDNDTHGPFCSTTFDFWAFANLPFERIEFFLKETIIQPNAKANYSNGGRSDVIGSFFNRDETLFSRYIDHFSKNHQGVLMPLDVVSTYLFLKQVLPCLPYYPINEADVLRIKKRFSDFLDLHIEKTLGEDPKTAFENLLARDLKSVSFFGDSVDFYKVIEKRVCQKYPEGQSLLSPEETKNIKNIFYLDHYLKTFTDEQICAALPFLYECAVKREVFLAEGVFKRAVITLSKNSDYAAFVEPAMKSNFFLENNMTQRNQYSKEDKDRFDLWTSLPLDARLSSKADQALRRKM